MTERVKHIDVLVHPDFNTLDAFPIPQHKQQLLHERWKDRAAEIATDPTRILVYYSSHIVTEKIADSGQHKTWIRDWGVPGAYEQERARIDDMREQLTDRFVLLSGAKTPSQQELKKHMEKRGMTIFDDADMQVYGEYFDRCVKLWGKITAQSFLIPAEQIVFDPRLSLATDGTIGR